QTGQVPLEDMGARLRGADEEVPFLLRAKTLSAGDRFTLATDLGELDLLGTPAGTAGYEDLAPRAPTWIWTDSPSRSQASRT
ncbi:MAG: hypothetical protein ACRDJ5_09020, partial [Actinomycetota bacterium]